MAGRSGVARLFATLFPRCLADPRYALDAELSVAEVNGQLAALGWGNGKLVAALVPEFNGGMITRCASWPAIEGGEVADAE